ncbi:MAG: cache domain-containing protein [Candidatus Sumerlaeia bacterium]
MGILKRFRQYSSLRLKMTVILTIVIFVANAALSVATILFTREVYIERVQDRVQSDLNSARRLYNQHIENIRRFLEGVAVEHAYVRLSQSPQFSLAQQMQRIQSRGELDICTLLDAEGRVIMCSNNPDHQGDIIQHNPLIKLARQTEKVQTGTIILSREALQKEGEELARRARIEILPTPNARPLNKEIQQDGIAIGAVVPITNGVGEVTAFVYGANLLNRRYDIVDDIKADVFQNDTWRGKDIGTATIFQGDLRISTNVTRREGERAIGTRLSREVYRRLYEEARPWYDRAFVVEDWYITAYEPIRNPMDEVVGALYVGLLEEPFQRRWTIVTAVFLSMMILTTLLSVTMIAIVVRQVLRPIGRVIDMTRRVIGGDLSARVGIRPSGEMGELCEEIDQMAEAVMTREEQLKEATSRQVSQSEKLASIGRLAAGIAHEINNPLGAVVTMSHLLREKIGQEQDDIEDLDLIIRETSRVSEIVKGLLDFSREMPSEKRPVDMTEVIESTLKLIQGDKSFRHIDIQKELPPEGLPLVYADRNQMQQVLINISLNACQAMPEKGLLKVRAYEENQRLKIEIRDTGVGIPEENLGKIFEPFFTTKAAEKGTGLGLSVTYGIIDKHGGHIEVDSTVGEGTTFTIVLPLCDEEGRPIS